MPFYKTGSTPPSSPCIARYGPVISCNMEPWPAIFQDSTPNTLWPSICLNNYHLRQPSQQVSIYYKGTSWACGKWSAWGILSCRNFPLPCWPSFTQLSEAAWDEGGEPVLTESILTSSITGTVHPTLWWYRGFFLVHGC